MALVTCPKCGQQYYGVGCPACDFPASPTNAPSLGVRIFLGAVFLAVGAFGLWMQHSRQTSWPALVISGLFLLGAVQIFGNFKGRISAFIAAALAAGLASLMFLAAGDSNHISGGVPFLPSSWNHRLGAVAFGGGGIIVSLMAAEFLFNAVKPKRKPSASGAAHVP